MSNTYQVSEENLGKDLRPGDEYGSLEKAVAGDYQFSIGNVLSEAWEKTYGVKWQFQIAFLYYFLAIIAVVVVLSLVVGGIMSVSQGMEADGLVNLIFQLGINLVILPIAMGIMMMGIKRSVGAPVDASTVFNYFSSMLPLLTTMIIMYVMIFIGFALLVVPGIYLMIAYLMAMPLVVEKKMTPWQALEASRKAITHRWFSVFGLFFILGAIMAIATIPLGIGLIWTIPMLYIALGVLYRNMFGVEKATVTE